MVTAIQDVDWRQVHGLDDGRQWFEARFRSSPGSSDLRRAAQAVAFNQTPTALRLLRSIIRSQPRSKAASQAYELLSRVYLRSGQYKRLIQNLDAWASAFPDREEIKRERKDIEQFRRLPDQINGPRHLSTLHHDGGIVVPLMVNGKPARFFFDTGAWLSAVTQTQAKQLGMEMRDGSGALSDASGSGTPIRFAVARELTLGAMQFHDVSFAVIPDQQSSPNDEPPPGILGIPVLLAAETIRWAKDGTIEFGRQSEPRDDAAKNLVFYRNRLLLQVNVMGQRVFGTLDTGAVSTDLNRNFAAEFDDYVRRTGTPERQSITGVGGTTVAEGVKLAEVVFDISGVKASLRPATVTMQRHAAIGGDCCVGNIGLDILTTGPAFTIDLSRMTLRLNR